MKKSYQVLYEEDYYSANGQCYTGSNGGRDEKYYEAAQRVELVD